MPNENPNGPRYQLHLSAVGGSVQATPHPTNQDKPLSPPDRWTGGVIQSDPESNA